MDRYKEPENLVALFENSLRKHSLRPLFGTPDNDGHYNWVTYDFVGARIDHLRSGLAKLGIAKDDAIGMIAKNRVEWAVAAFAAFGLGARFIPMYEKELPKIWSHIIRDGGIKVLFVADMSIYLQIQRIRHEMPNLAHLFLIDGDQAESMADLQAGGRRQPVSPVYPEPNDIAVLIYTSGTTGNPKGVLLSHGNLASNVRDGGARFPEITSDSRSLSILPWAHSYGQTAELYNFIHRGGSIGFIRDITTITEDIARVAPTFLIAVPRVFNKIYDGLRSKMEEAGGMAKTLFELGLKSAARKRALTAQGKRAFIPTIVFKVVDRIVFSKIRKRFGGRLLGALTASAMMNMKVAEFFNDIGLPVFDAYGLTETSPAVTMNCRQANKPGSVGRPIDNVRVVIDHSRSQDNPGEGEVIVYGPNVMKGYHNNPEATHRVMTVDGGFRTGDIGWLDDDGFLYITGRIKEQYKLENGKYVFPAALEEEIQLLPWVENVMIFGEGKRHNICLVVPDFVKLRAWAGQMGISGAAKELVVNEQVKTLISQAVAKQLQKKFRGYEIPRSFILVDEPFSVENGMLTQTLKLKRRQVFQRYADRIEAAYASA